MRIKNLPSIESMDGSQDALVIEQTDGSEDKSRKVSPAQIKQYVLGEIDEVPTEDSDNLVKSGGIFSTMAVPKYDATNRREYFEGGGAFDGNIDSSPTAGSNNAVASGGTKAYVDGKVVVEEVSVTNSVAIPAGTYKRFDIPCTKSGYTPVGIVGIRGSGNGLLSVMEYLVQSNDGIAVYLVNNTSSSITPLVIYARVLYIKN